MSTGGVLNGGGGSGDSSVAIRVFSRGDTSEARVRGEALKICQQYVGQRWNDVTVDEIELERLSGMTNYVFKVSHCPSNSDSKDPIAPLLLRIHGSAGHELVIETVTASILAERNYGPKLFGIFPEGRLEQFVQSRRLQLQDIRDPEMSVKIARKMAQFHKLQVPVMKSQWLLLQVTKDYFGLLEKVKALDETQELLKREIIEFDYEQEIQFMKSHLSQSKSPIVFCHNDMQEGNILCTEGDNELLLIDYEYSCYNYQHFDIVNHLLEWTADYEVEERPFFKVDPTKFPSRLEQMRFLTTYFEEHSGFEPGSVEMTEACERVMAEEDLFACYSHLMWASWAICIQYHVAVSPPPTPTSKQQPEAKDSVFDTAVPFDYIAYSAARLQMYREKKQKLISKGDDIA